MKILQLLNPRFWKIAIKIFLFKRSMRRQTNSLTLFFKTTVFDLPIDEAAIRVNKLRFKISSLPTKDILSSLIVNLTYEICNDIDMYLKFKKVLTARLKATN